MKYKWQIKSYKSNNEGISGFSFHPVLMRVLLSRGTDTAEKLDAYLDKTLKSLHDPELMQDMKIAADRLAEAVKNKEKVLIYGDYDVDGVTSIAVMVHFFRFNGIEPDFYVPHRIHDGYGLNKEIVKKYSAKGTTLIITVDTGINNFDEVEEARKNSIDVIITDHHKPSEKLPDAYAVVNPNRKDCQYPNKKLAGVGVAFKLVHAALRRLAFEADECKNFLTRLMDYVTLGTIADLASLEDENRKIVSYGLKTIKNSTFPGVRILVEQAVVGSAPVSAGTVAYRITPKLNASGRVDHGQVSAKLLIENDMAECRKYFSKIDIMNRERQMIEEKDLKKAVSLISPSNNDERKIIVLYDKSFRAGVNGIIAARIVERYSLPAIVLASDGRGCLKGSARTVKNFNIYNCIDSARELLESFGGHAFAAGLTIKEENLPLFREKMEAFAAGYAAQKVFEPMINIDTQIDLKEIDDTFVESFRKMEPFGLGNPEPIFLSKNIRLKTPPQIMRGKHVKFKAGGEAFSEFEVIGFNMADYVDGVLEKNDKIDIVFKIGINHWLGQEKLQLEMVDFEKVAEQQ